MAAFLVVLAFQLGAPELALFAVYLAARAVELGREDGDFGLSTIALWSIGVGLILISTRSQAWASAAEALIVLFGMGATRVGRRVHPVGAFLLLVLVAAAARLPLAEILWYVLHGGLVCFLLGFAWVRSGHSPDAPARRLAAKLDGHFDLESQEIRVPKGEGAFVGTLRPPRCVGAMPPRAVQKGAALTIRTCECGVCRRLDPEGECQTVRVTIDGHTLTLAHRGFEHLVRSLHQAELRDLLRRLAALPQGSVTLADGEVTVRAGGVAPALRDAGPREEADWRCRTGEQLFRLGFALYDYLDRSATQAYR